MPYLLNAAQQARLNKICRGAKDLFLGNALQDEHVINVRYRFTAAQVNAGGLGLTPPIGKMIRPVDYTMIAIGGNAAGATTVDVLTGATKLLAVAVAALTRSAVVRAGAANATVLADGESFVPLSPGATITVGKTGNDLTGATHIDVILSFTLL